MSFPAIHDVVFLIITMPNHIHDFSSSRNHTFSLLTRLPDTSRCLNPGSSQKTIVEGKTILVNVTLEYTTRLLQSEQICKTLSITHLSTL